MVEGVKVLQAALDAGAPIESLYYAPEALSHGPSLELLETARSRGTRCFALGPGVLERVCDAASPQPICAVASFVDVGLEAVTKRSPLLVAVDVRDPGNIGTLLRVADAASSGGVIICNGSSDPYNPKAVRASAGSIFNVPVVLDLEAKAALDLLGDANYRRVATLAHGGEDYATSDLSGKVAIIVGNEANGLDESYQRLVDQGVTIEMGGGAESLNVAMAATIILFEIARQARLGAPHRERALP